MVFSESKLVVKKDITFFQECRNSTVHYFFQDFSNVGQEAYGSIVATVIKVTFLKIGYILASFSIDGKIPLVRDLLISLVRTGTRIRDAVWIRRVGMLLGPDALDALSELMILASSW
jgi:hypothetical protein